MSAVINTVEPADLSTITRETPIVINVSSIPPRLAIWCKLENRAETLVVYDNGEFLYPFETRSSAQLETDGSTTFTIIEDGGWESGIESLAVEPAA